MDVCRVLLVDDERLARVRLRQLLKKYHAGVEVVGEASSVAEAVEVLRFCEVDLIFLDVQMPGGDGFSLFERCAVKARVVFVTAFEEHALRAFEVNALDYLVKPVEAARLRSSLERVGHVGGVTESLPVFEKTDRVCLEMSSGLRFVGVGEILCISGADDYCEVHLAEGEMCLSRDRLGSWEERLGSAGFFRSHRSHLINLAHVEGLVREGGQARVLVRGMKEALDVGRRRVKALKELLVEGC